MVSSPRLLQPESVPGAVGQPQSAQWKGPAPPVSKPHLQFKLSHDSHSVLRVRTTSFVSGSPKEIYANQW